MTTHKVTLIPGDGIGPEVIEATVRMLEATGVKFEWESFAAGAEAFEKYHEYIPKELSESIERTRVGLKGPVTTPIGGGFSSINVELRKRFELFANFRPIRNLPHIPTRYPGIDLIVVRETRKDSTPASNMKSFPEWWRASRSSAKKLPPASRGLPSNTPARTSARRFIASTKPTS